MDNQQRLQALRGIYELQQTNNDVRGSLETLQKMKSIKDEIEEYNQEGIDIAKGMQSYENTQGGV